MKHLLVGGQLLGRRSYERIDEAPNFLPWKAFSPLVTPPLRNKTGPGRETNRRREPTERFILLPSPRFVTVLAYKTGKTIAYIVPSTGKEGYHDQRENEVMITSATLAIYPPRHRVAVVDDLLRIDQDTEDERVDTDAASVEWAEEHVLLIGCNDGSLREFSLIELTDSAMYRQTARIIPTHGQCHLKGISVGPRRVNEVCKGRPIIFLSSVNVQVNGTWKVVVYAIVAEKDDQPLENLGDIETKAYSLRRVVLKRGEASEASETDLTSNCVQLDQFQCQPDSKSYDNSPFNLITACQIEGNRFQYDQDNSSRQMIFISVARPTQLTIYCDYVTKEGGFEENLRFPPVPFYMHFSNALASVAVSTNGKDIACGKFSGEIVILCEVFTIVADYCLSLSLLQGQTAGIELPKPKHPSKSVITRNVHWHAHPVSSLAYQSTGSMVDPMLYSGGEESVLVNWQLSRGTYRPANVLPRVSKGGILNIQIVDDDCGGPSGILVATEDNTLQLFESHNRSLQWKVQGLAHRSTLELSAQAPPMKANIFADPRGDSSLLVLTGLPDAPGYIHWYDTEEQRVARTLEVAPYNRVSKVERQDSPMPSPAISHCAFSASGDDLVTIDVTPTENASIGASLIQDGGGASFGSVSTIKFWSFESQSRVGMSMPYQLIAAMTFPHGPENFVSALAISRDGQCCCSVSNGEKTIRIWYKTNIIGDDDEDGVGDDDTMDRRRPLWICRDRITSPAGFSNMTTRTDGVAFSTDGSILAICYGNMITLWDHQEASFLTSLLHLEDDRSPIDKIQFLPLERSLDMILTKSASGVALQSPFARCGVMKGWSWVLPVDDPGIVTDAQVILSHEMVAISMYCRRNNQSRVVFLDVVTGNAINDVREKAECLVAELAGGIISMSSDCSALKRNVALPEKSVQVNVLTNQGELLTLVDDDSSDVVAQKPTKHLFGAESSSNVVPKIPDWMLPVVGNDNIAKRSHTMMVNTMEDDTASPQKRFALENFGSLVHAHDGTSSTPVPTAELPSLSGEFARAFIGRNLVRNHHNR